MQTFPAITDAWYLTGPTAAGKSTVGVELAQQLNAEIISLDSMAVYRGMDIGTAKPSVDQRRCVPHHLIDLVDPDQDFSVAQYLQAAHRCREQIHTRGRQVLFVGGTPLYMKALLRGLCSGPPADWDLRQQLSGEAAAGGPEQLHRRLAEVDPQAAAKLHPQDTRRLIRALEVYQQSGGPISGYQHQFPAASAGATRRVFVLDWPRDQLHQRIDGRVDQMFAAGLVAEVRQLLSRYERLSRTAAQAAGYREVAAFLRGECELATAIQQTKTRTRQLARRQLTWFRSLSECHWIQLAEPLALDRLVRQMLAVAPG